MLHIKYLLHNLIFFNKAIDRCLTPSEIFSATLWTVRNDDDDACIVHSDQDFYNDSSQSTSIIDMYYMYYTQKDK